MYNVVDTLSLRGQRLLSALVRPEAGQTMIEYALLASLLSIAAISLIILMGPQIQDTWQHIIDGLNQLDPNVNVPGHPHPCPPRNPHC